MGFKTKIVIHGLDDLDDLGVPFQETSMTCWKSTGLVFRRLFFVSFWQATSSSSPVKPAAVKPAAAEDSVRAAWVGQASNVMLGWDSHVRHGLLSLLSHKKGSFSDS